MKVYEILECDMVDMKDTNQSKAKKIAIKAKEKAKKANPGENETAAQAHLGSHVSTTWLNR